MLDQAEVNVGRLLYWAGLTGGVFILVFNLVSFHPGLGSVGISLVVGACGLSIRRSVADHEKSLRDAFELGRDHERLQSVQTLR